MGSNDKQLNVVFAADKGYTPHLATALVSLFEHNSSLVNRVFLLTGTPNYRGFRTLQTFVREKYHFEIEMRAIEGDELSHLPVSGHVSQATYSRFLLGSLLPQELETVLYLDADLIVVGDISELLKQEVFSRNDFAKTPILGAVPSTGGDHLSQFGHSGEGYFNAGVLLVNLKGWRDSNIEKRLFQEADLRGENLKWWDQDALNFVFDKQWLPISPIYNNTNARTIDINNRIVHFAGSSKPWMYGSGNPYTAAYNEFRSATPFHPYLKAGLLRHLKLLSRKKSRRLFRKLISIARTLFH